MKAKHFTFLFMIFILYISCEELRRKLCKDTALSLERVDYTGKELRTDGFYYADRGTDFRGVTIYETLVFYRNGILMLPGTPDSDEIEEYMTMIGKGKMVKEILPQNVKCDWVGGI